MREIRGTIGASVPLGAVLCMPQNNLASYINTPVAVRIVIAITESLSTTFASGFIIRVVANVAGSPVVTECLIEIMLTSSV